MLYKNIEEFVELAKSNIKIINNGTLRFCGDWFGRPMDNCHKPKQIDFKDNKLVIIFVDNYQVTIENPIEIITDKCCFIVTCSGAVKYEYGHYGPTNEEKKYYLKYLFENGGVEKESGLIKSNVKNRSRIEADCMSFEIVGY